MVTIYIYNSNLPSRSSSSLKVKSLGSIKVRVKIKKPIHDGKNKDSDEDCFKYQIKPKTSD